MADDSVLQSWVQKLPYKMQTTLLTGIRGPDTHHAPNVKRISKWIRGLIVRPGDPNNLPFMEADLPGRIFEKGTTATELEFCTQHFYSHLMHCLQILGYHHPEATVADRALALYEDMCRLMHLHPESREEMWKRIGWKIWPGNKQPDNIREAIDLMQAAKA